MTSVLKESSAKIAQVLAFIFNQSLIQAIVPDDWHQANVAPIYKKGEKYSPANYRPVSLTCICCKTLEYILVSKIMQHLSEHDILVDMSSVVEGLARLNFYSLSMIYANT